MELPGGVKGWGVSAAMVAAQEEEEEGEEEGWRMARFQMMSLSRKLSGGSTC